MAAIRASRSTPRGVLAWLKQAMVGTSPWLKVPKVGCVSLMGGLLSRSGGIVVPVLARCQGRPALTPGLTRLPAKTKLPPPFDRLGPARPTRGPAGQEDHAMAILTISQEMGSGGAEIGMAAATRLGYTYVDQEELLGRAKRYGLAEDRLARLAEDRPSWVERFDAETRRYILALQVVLYEFAQDDNVVLMGGGGQWLLRGLPHVLRTRIVAPFPVRVTPKTVAQFIRRDDIQKAARMRYLFDTELKDPSLYDLLINTAVLSREAAVGLLPNVALAVARGAAGTENVKLRIAEIPLVTPFPG